MSGRDDIFGEESEINEMYAEELKEAKKEEEGSFFSRAFSDEPEPAVPRRPKSTFAGLSGVEDISLEDIDKQTVPPPPPPQFGGQPYYQGQPQYGQPYLQEPERMGMDEPVMPAHNDLSDKAMTYRNSQPPKGYQNPYSQPAAPMGGQPMGAQGVTMGQPGAPMGQQPMGQPGAQPQRPPQPIPSYQVGANDPYATNSFQSSYTDTSMYRTQGYGAQQMYGAPPQQGYPQYGQGMQQPMQGGRPMQGGPMQGGPMQGGSMQQGAFNGGQPNAMGGYPNGQPQNGGYRQGSMSYEEGLAMVSQMMAENSTSRNGFQARQNYRNAMRPGMDRKERAKAQVDEMLAQDKASHEGTDRLVQALNSSGTSYGRRGAFGGMSRAADERPSATEGMGWYFLWFCAGALIPFGAFDLHFAFCLMIGALFGVIGAVIKHNGMEGFDFRTSLTLSKTELLLVPITAVIGLALYFYL